MQLLSPFVGVMMVDGDFLGAVPVCLFDRGLPFISLLSAAVGGGAVAISAQLSPNQSIAQQAHHAGDR